MAEFNLQTSILLDTNRCYACRRWYAYERPDTSRATCPYCAHDRIKRAELAQEKAERQTRSLRGALTRARKKPRGGGRG